MDLTENSNSENISILSIQTKESGSTTENVDETPRGKKKSETSYEKPIPNADKCSNIVLDYTSGPNSGTEYDRYASPLITEKFKNLEPETCTSIQIPEREAKIVEGTFKCTQAEWKTGLKMERSIILTKDSENKETCYSKTTLKHKNAPIRGSDIEVYRPQKTFNDNEDDLVQEFDKANEANVLDEVDSNEKSKIKVDMNPDMQSTTEEPRGGIVPEVVQNLKTVVQIPENVDEKSVSGAFNKKYGSKTAPTNSKCLDRAKATRVEAKTAETVSPGVYKDGHIEILSNYKIEKSVQILKKNPRYNEKIGENIEDPSVKTDGGKLTDKNQDSRDVLSQPRQPDESASHYGYKSTPQFSKNGKVEPQERETANVFGREYSNMAPKTQLFGKKLCKIWS